VIICTHWKTPFGAVTPARLIPVASNAIPDIKTGDKEQVAGAGYSAPKTRNCVDWPSFIVHPLYGSLTHQAPAAVPAEVEGGLDAMLAVGPVTLKFAVAVPPHFWSAVSLIDVLAQ
jgi:hypothetical protein